MAKRERRVGYGWPVLLAIGVHIAALMLTVIKWPESTPDPTSSSVVQATLVRAETATNQPQQTKDATPPATSQPKDQEDASQPAASPPPEPSDQPTAESDVQIPDEVVEEAKAQAQRLQEEARRAAQQRAEAERQRQKEAAQRQAQAEAERKRQAQAEAERKRQAQAEAERKRQAQAEAEQKRQAQAEAEQKRLAALAERAAQANASSLDELISEEQQSIANAEQASEAANGFKNLVRRYVEQSWNLPSNISSDLRAIVQIQLLPTGELVSATILQSSGNSTFDRSAINAIEKASPFREMSKLDASVRDQFREFNLDFNPEDIR
ncbi:cell division and transport-associated protein TolA [Chromohalobacter marismortui]|uniref:Cell division and transport-associated protein TolA n=1 Tax=Chromohalobacter marismortui TaxID=42055 RepID=A0A4R7NP77_9GAMM|nr:MULTISPECIES: cell envelope integrity protein TolA [Chromohalobacter]MCI0508960.1 cell envelope integrity protein TolA [Chromohalobacter sp.]MCI0592310.1 cell envelope integrity protein TolA [Chromohalobacter sp.]TDU22665.1 cell division and transport-associated protein TolA [Chromohalobacter marismortui]